MVEERKKCPQCGHGNRISAKVCANCGYRFISAQIQGLRKFCTQCGTANRIRARVCMQCGKAFRSASPTVVQKWCPQCGKPRHTTTKALAKVCSNCGYRFRTSVRTQSHPEPPVKPFADSPLTLPPLFDEPIPLPPDEEPRKVDPVSTVDDQHSSGEPAPFISSDELNQLRGKGVYNRRTTEQTLTRISKKR